MNHSANHFPNNKEHKNEKLINKHIYNKSCITLTLIWKFRQQQFQFDIDFTFSLIATLIISVWIIISMITLIIKTVKHLKKT